MRYYPKHHPWGSNTRMVQTTGVQTTGLPVLPLFRFYDDLGRFMFGIRACDEAHAIQCANSLTSNWSQCGSPLSPSTSLSTAE